MHPFHHAARTPDKPAIIMADSGATMSYAELEGRSNQIAHLFRACGLQRGDAVAILLKNHIDYLPLCWGAQRAGLIFTCISTRLQAEEASYIITDCGASLLLVDSELANIARDLPTIAHRFSVGGAIPGYQPLETALQAQPKTRIADESAGRDMLYSSGTTGRPKGIVIEMPEGPIDEVDNLAKMAAALYEFDDNMIYLSPAPLYHAAPIRYCMTVHKFGGTVIVMKKFDAEHYLQLVEKYRVTHTQMVPTMFVRMLKLPPDVRQKYDVSSLVAVVHAAAPCPVAVKEQMIDWFGPCIYEYYSATESSGMTAINSEEWLQKKGSVGRAMLGEVRIVDENENLLPTGQTGRVFFEGGPEASYHNDPEKTASARGKYGSTFGDIGYVDEDGYLFLTDRASYMIISGGVNVYPQEAEDILIMHPKVADAAVIGVPNEELGEEVKAVVQPRSWEDAGPELAAELVEFCRARLSHIKCPRSIDFDPALPRHDTGKLYKRLLKDRYWPKAG